MKRGSRNARFAKALGVTESRVSQLRRLGMPTTSTRAAREWHKANVRRRDGVTAAATQRLVAAKADVAEARLRALEASLVEREDAVAMQREALKILRGVWATFAERVAGPVAGMKDAGEIQVFMAREADRLLAASADAIERWARAQLARDGEAT